MAEGMSLQERMAAKQAELTQWARTLARLVPEERLLAILRRHRRGIPVSDLRRWMGRDGEGKAFSRKRVEGMMHGLERQRVAQVLRLGYTDIEGVNGVKKLWILCAYKAEAEAPQKEGV